MGANRFSGIFTSTLIGAATLAGMAAPAADPVGPGPITSALLPDWLRSQTKPDHVLRVALVGCNPDAQARRLRPDDRFRMRLRGGRHPPSSREDTELVAWLRLAAPRLSLNCAPLPAGKDESGAALAGGVSWALVGPGCWCSTAFPARRARLPASPP